MMAVAIQLRCRGSPSPGVRSDWPLWHFPALIWHFPALIWHFPVLILGEGLGLGLGSRWASGGLREWRGISLEGRALATPNGVRRSVLNMCVL